MNHDLIIHALTSECERLQRQLTAEKHNVLCEIDYREECRRELLLKIERLEKQLLNMPHGVQG